MKITKPLVKDNCKDCVSNCEHAGKDREFVCRGGVSCKKTKREFDINNVYFYYDFTQVNPLLYVAYVEDNKFYTLKYCTFGAEAFGTKELEKLWEIATDPQNIKEIGETNLKNLKKLYGVNKNGKQRP